MGFKQNSCSSLMRCLGAPCDGVRVTRCGKGERRGIVGQIPRGPHPQAGRAMKKILVYLGSV